MMEVEFTIWGETIRGRIERRLGKLYFIRRRNRILVTLDTIADLVARENKEKGMTHESD